MLIYVSDVSRQIQHQRSPYSCAPILDSSATKRAGYNTGQYVSLYFKSSCVVGPEQQGMDT